MRPSRAESLSGTHAEGLIKQGHPVRWVAAFGLSRFLRLLSPISTITKHCQIRSWQGSIDFSTELIGQTASQAAEGWLITIVVHFQEGKWALPYAESCFKWTDYFPGLLVEPVP